MSVVGSVSPPVLFRRRDLYRPLRTHRLTAAMSRPRSELGTRPASKPLLQRRPVTPSDKSHSQVSAQTRAGQSLSSLTSANVANAPVSADVTRTSRALTQSSSKSPVTAAATASHADSTALTVNKLSRTLVKSLSADKAKSSLKTSSSSGEHPVTSTESSVSKSKSATNVKTQAKPRTDIADKEVKRKDTKTPTSAKVLPPFVYVCNCCIVIHCTLSLAAQCIVIGPICLCVCLWVCYHDNSKLHASIFTKLDL